MYGVIFDGAIFKLNIISATIIMPTTYAKREFFENIAHKYDRIMGSPHIRIFDILAPTIAKSLKQINQHTPTIYAKNINLK